jgi:hypothetical protein
MSKFVMAGLNTKMQASSGAIQRRAPRGRRMMAANAIIPADS